MENLTGKNFILSTDLIVDGRTVVATKGSPGVVTRRIAENTYEVKFSNGDIFFLSPDDICIAELSETICDNITDLNSQIDLFSRAVLSRDIGSAIMYSTLIEQTIKGVLYKMGREI